ncbi:Hypothetical_protein [Hexamita inflata]|uniref:Hypothetical_protein n=1 Tax=Hexamita inflata TaxID=28002 RepID=A0AA86QIS9_9EUKA|nr:Hypothetical protein HINF_LOCUS41619 [Hexamita inflata]
MSQQIIMEDVERDALFDQATRVPIPVINSFCDSVVTAPYHFLLFQRLYESASAALKQNLPALPSQDFARQSCSLLEAMCHTSGHAREIRHISSQSYVQLAMASDRPIHRGVRISDPVQIFRDLCRAFFQKKKIFVRYAESASFVQIQQVLKVHNIKLSQTQLQKIQQSTCKMNIKELENVISLQQYKAIKKEKKLTLKLSEVTSKLAALKLEMRKLRHSTDFYQKLQYKRHQHEQYHLQALKVAHKRLLRSKKENANALIANSKEMALISHRFDELIHQLQNEQMEPELTFLIQTGNIQQIIKFVFQSETNWMNILHSQKEIPEIVETFFRQRIEVEFNPQLNEIMIATILRALLNKKQEIKGILNKAKEMLENGRVSKELVEILIKIDKNKFKFAK